VPSIVGFGLAVELAEQQRDEAVRSMAACRAALVSLLEAIPGVELFEPGTERVPSLVAVRVPWAPAEVVMHHLEARGVYVSSGSACQAGRTQTSPGALALGLDGEAAKHLLRWSFSASTTLDEVTRGAKALAEVAADLGSTSEARVR